MWPSSTRPWPANLFPGQDPIGRVIRQDKETYTIVGVARNSKSRTIGEKPVNAAYLFLNAAPEKATSFFGTTIIVKTTVNPRGLARSVREQIAALDPNMAVFNDETMQEHVDKSLLLPRISALLLGIFGVVGLTLAAVGLYGVMSYSVRSRTREIGIRMALGAKPRTVLRMILRQGLVLTGIGLGIGLLIALLVGRFTASRALRDQRNGSAHVQRCFFGSARDCDSRDSGSSFSRGTC